MPMPNLQQVRAYFDERIQTHGASPRGADWNSAGAQEARFEQLLGLVRQAGPFSLLDYGSGYGALADYLEQRGYDADYTGYDLLESAVAAARQHHRGKPKRRFCSEEAELVGVDYVIASGIFNFRGAESFESWTDHVQESLSAPGPSTSCPKFVPGSPHPAALGGARRTRPDGALCTRSFLYMGRNPARTSGFSYWYLVPQVRAGFAAPWGRSASRRTR